MTSLKGTMILDLTRLLPGAYGSMLMGDLGAEVIKIEQPGIGDYMRKYPPYYFAVNHVLPLCLFAARQALGGRISLSGKARIMPPKEPV